MDGGLVILQDLIATLEVLPPDAPVIVGHTGCPPDEFMSWRGIYSQLTLTPYGQDTKTVKELLTEALECVGKAFMGYKGGAFTMNGGTDVYADEYGTAYGYKIDGISIEAVTGTVILITNHEGQRA